MQKIVIFLGFVTFIALCTGVSGAINALNLLKSGMGVDLRGTERSMSQELLDRADVGAIIEHGGGKSMAQDVRRMFLERRDGTHTRAHDSI